MFPSISSLFNIQQNPPFTGPGQIQRHSTAQLRSRGKEKHYIRDLKHYILLRFGFLRSHGKWRNKCEWLKVSSLQAQHGSHRRFAVWKAQFSPRYSWRTSFFQWTQATKFTRIPPRHLARKSVGNPSVQVRPMEATRTRRQSLALCKSLQNGQSHHAQRRFGRPRHRCQRCASKWISLLHCDPLLSTQSTFTPIFFCAKNVCH